MNKLRLISAMMLFSGCASGCGIMKWHWEKLRCFQFCKKISKSARNIKSREESSDICVRNKEKHNAIVEKQSFGFTRRRKL